MENLHLEKAKEFNKQFKRQFSVYKSAILLNIRFVTSQINSLCIAITPEMEKG